MRILKIKLSNVLAVRTWLLKQKVFLKILTYSIYTLLFLCVPNNFAYLSLINSNPFKSFKDSYCFQKQ